MPAVPTTPTPALGKLVGELGRLAAEARTTLGNQREIAGRVPATVLDGLNTLRDSLEKIQPQVAAQEAELGRLRALAATAEVVNSSLDLTTVLSEVMDTIIRLTSAERGFLMLKDERGELQFRIARGMERETLNKSDFQVSRTILNTVAEAGQPVVTTNAAADPRFSAQESVIGYNLRSIVCVPLKFKERVTGVIYVDNRIRTGLFTEKERDLLAAFATQAAIAIENARQYQQVVELKELLDNVFASMASGVITTDVGDMITLCNHAAEQILGLSRAQIEGQPLSQALPIGETLSQVVSRVRTEQRPMVGHEVNPTLPLRGLVNWNLNVSPLRDSGQGSQGLAIVVDDVTEKKRLQNKYEVFTRMVPPQVVERLDVNSLKLGGVRRTVSIVFADIQGFTTLSETLDPEIVIEKLNRYVGTAAEAMLLQEATVDKYIGDAVMAFFNAPHDQSDHVLRAVRAAIQMRDDITDLRDTMEPQFRLNFRVAVHMGEAVVGLVGTKDRLDYTIIGDTVNTAKRIQENGVPGKVIISEEVYQAVKDEVVVNPLEAMHVKGKVQPVTVYELVGLQ
ncbi:MAG: GAF domain-containing protein [Anaerolineales bacterium]|nr:GAF domain-containing protein [Anaerolineales bacterium]